MGIGHDLTLANRRGAVQKLWPERTPFEPGGPEPFVTEGGATWTEVRLRT